jgi:hypothetical protein
LFLVVGFCVSDGIVLTDICYGRGTQLNVLPFGDRKDGSHFAVQDKRGLGIEAGLM